VPAVRTLDLVGLDRFHDTLRALGWTLPEHAPGALARIAAWLAVPFTLAKEGSVSQARGAYEYLTQDRARLFPAVAFETVAGSLLRLATGAPAREASELERRLAHDLEALVFVHVPQLPSSRATGSWPVAALVLFTAVVFPAIVISLMIYLLLPLQFGRSPRHAAFVFRLLRGSEPWGMVEVFMLGILCSIVKLAHLASLTVGPSLWAFGALIVLVAAGAYYFEPSQYWARVEGSPRRAPHAGAVAT